MFNVDPAVLHRMQPHIERVLIVDPHAPSGQILSDLMRELGARTCVRVATCRAALETAGGLRPQLIFSEFAGPGLDGAAFTTALRRSPLPARRAPVIIATNDARATSIAAARDAGAHEFLCKPFTSANVFRRVRNVVLTPRPWVEASRYVGPDRRRFNSAAYEGRCKRAADARAAAEAALRREIARLDADPKSALAVMRANLSALEANLVSKAEVGLGDALMAFRVYLDVADAGGPVQKADAEERLNLVLQRHDALVQSLGPPPTDQHRAPMPYAAA